MKLRDAVPTIERELQELAARGNLRGAEGISKANVASREYLVRSHLAHITIATDLDAALFPHACLYPIAGFDTPVDYVQECATEKLELRRELLVHMDHVLTARLDGSEAANLEAQVPAKSASRFPIIASSDAAIASSGFYAHLALRQRALLAHPVCTLFP